MNPKSLLRPFLALFFTSTVFAAPPPAVPTIPALPSTPSVPATPAAPVTLAVPAIPASAFEVIGKPTPLTPASSLEIRFASPIVGEDAVGRPTDRLPVVTEPAIDAHFVWDSQRSGRIIFHAPPTIGARYEISPRSGLKDAAGDPVTAEKPAVIRSAPFRVANRLPRYFRYSGNSLDDRSPKFILEFNDPVDPKSLARTVFFQDKSGRRIAAEVTRPKKPDFPENHQHPKTWSQQFEAALAAADAKDLTEDAVLPVPPVENPFAHAILVTPTDPLPVGESWSLIVGKDTPNSAATAATVSPYVIRLGNIPPFTVRSVYPLNPYGEGRWFQVYFSKNFPKDTKAEDIADWVAVEPAPENLELKLTGRSLTIAGDFVRGKKYRVTVKPGLRAADGTFLNEVTNKEFTFTPNQPFLSIPAFEATQISSGQKRFDISSGNLESVRLRVKALEGDELPYALRGYERYNSNVKGSTGLTYDLVPGRTVFEKSFKSVAEIDESDRFVIDWDEVLGEDKKFAAIFVHVEGRAKSGTGHRHSLGSQALIQISDIGLVTKIGRDKTLIFAFSHKDGSPLAGVDLNLIDRENRPLGNAKTDANGVAELPIHKDSHWLAASRGEDRHIIDFTSNMSTIPTWRYRIPVEWDRPPEVRRRTFLFVERPVYRPGETVHLKGYARQLLGDDLEVDARGTATLKLRDPRYRTILEKEITLSDTGSFAEDLVIPSAGNLGYYSVQIDYQNEDNPSETNREYSSRYASIGFQVADFRPNTFEVTLKGDDPKTADKEALIDLTALYYMGKPLSKAKVTWHSNIRSAGFNPKGFDKFVFGGGRDFGDSDDDDDSPSVATYGEFVLGDDGQSQLKVPIPSADGKPGARIFNVTTEVTDINQQTVAASKALRIEGSQFYLGIARPPYLTGAGNELPITVVALDPEGNPVPDPVESKVTIERIYYNTVRVKSVGGTKLEHKRFADKVLEKTINIAPLVVEAGKPTDPAPSLQFTPKDPGSYNITVESTDADGNPVRSGTYFYVYGGSPSWAFQNGNSIEMVPERSDYKPGETAKILLKTPVFGTALVTVERTGVLRHFTTEITEGKPVIEIPLSKEDGPNVFVSVMLVRGADNSGKKFPEPDYRLGYCQLMVESHGHKLEVAVTSSLSEYQPGDEVELTATVHDAAGNPVPNAEVTLYAVDEGVLSLMGYANPDPTSLFHRPLSLAVRTAISLTRLIPENPDERHYDNKGFVVGGGGDDAGDRLRDDFKPCAYWAPSLKTDQNGKATGKFTAPDGLTRYRTIAVVAAGAEKFGNAEGAIVVNKPLMLDPVVPRFANLSDKVWVKAVVHNTSKASGEFEVALTLDETTRFNETPPAVGPELSGGPNPLPAADRTMRRSVILKAGETGRVVFPVTFEKVGNARWIWSAKPIKVDKEVRGLADRVESKFEVRTPLPLLRESHYVTLHGNGKQGKNVLAKFSPELLEGEGEVVVTLSKTRLLEAKDAADYVLKYPYGCAEQSTSSLLPWLQLRDLKRALPSFSKHTDDHITAAIQSGADRILSMQTESGGLAYWPGGNSPELWASAYAGMGLLLAEKAGAKVPTEAINDLKKWLSKQLRDLSKEEDLRRLTDATLALYTLALAGAPESGYHDVLFKRRAGLNQETRYLLALTIAQAGGDHGLARVLLTEAPAPNDEWRFWTGRGYSKALKLLAWSRLDPNSTETAGALTGLLTSRDSRGTWGCTWNNAWSLLALGAYAENEQITEPAVTANYAKGAREGKLTLGEGLSSADLILPFTAAEGDTPLAIDIPGDATVYAHIELKARPKSLSQKPRSNGLSILRKYNKVLPDGTIAPADDLEIGDMVRVQLDIEIPGDTDYVAVDDPLPAAFEAVNPEFKTQASRDVDEGGWSPWYSDYRELRTDRALFFRDHVPNGGKFTLRYLARVIADGDTIAPPAKVEAMYHPDTYGLSATQQISTHK